MSAHAGALLIQSLPVWSRGQHRSVPPPRAPRVMNSLSEQVTEKIVDYYKKLDPPDCFVLSLLLKVGGLGRVTLSFTPSFPAAHTFSSRRRRNVVDVSASVFAADSRISDVCLVRYHPRGRTGRRGKDTLTRGTIRATSRGESEGSTSIAAAKWRRRRSRMTRRCCTFLFARTNL